MKRNEIALFCYSILKGKNLLLLDNKIPLVMENSVAIINVRKNIPSNETINQQESYIIDIDGDDVMNTTTNLNLLNVL